MNKLKKIASLLLALVMVFALTATAFATDNSQGGKTPGDNNQLQNSTTTDNVEQTVQNPNCSITVQTEEDNHNYIAYQIFVGDLSVTTKTVGDKTETTKTLSNIVWGDSVDTTKLAANLTSTAITGFDVADPTDATAVSNWLDGKSTEIAAQFARAISNCLTTTTHALTQSGNGYTVNGLKPGYYLIKDELIDNDPLKDDVYSANMMQVLGVEIMKPKAQKPTLDKNIVGPSQEETDRVKAVTSRIGETIPYELKSIVPNMQGYAKYDFTITDTMTSGLDFDESSFAVKIGNDVIDATNYSLTPNEDGHGFTFVFTKLYELVGGRQDGPNTITNPGTPITITYNATLNSNALETDVENNTAKLNYSNDPNNDESHTDTPDEKTYVYDFDIDIDKVDGKDATKKLDGAEFVLYRDVTTTAGDGTSATGRQYYKVDATTKVVTWVDAVATGGEYTVPTDATVVTTDTDGKASFTGLPAGTYYLKETKAPTGYNLLDNPVEVTITIETNEDGTLKTTSATVHEHDQLVQGTTVENNSGALLPETGGIGTTIFYIVGGVLAAGAVILLITKRRMNIDKD